MAKQKKLKLELWLQIILFVALSQTQVLGAPAELTATLQDGVAFKVYLPEDPQAEVYAYAHQVLQAACSAYQEIVFTQGFNKDGYAFADPTAAYAYDSDKVIEIFLADVDSPFALMSPLDDLEYEAKIFVPLNFQEYRQRYQIDQPEAELRASLTHELFHIIAHSYNRNMLASFQGKASLDCERWDWYTEGLARYFELIAGYDKEFLSEGFRQKSGKKVLVYKGGVNYFLQYPDKPLDERKYDFALFWQYIHRSYGMEKIEAISRKFRDIDPVNCTNLEAMQMIAGCLDIPLPALLQDFSLYVYEVSFLGTDDSFRPVTMYKLCPRETETHAICSFGFDFYELDLRQGLSSVSLNAMDGWEKLSCIIGVSYHNEFQVVSLENNYTKEIEIDLTELPKDSKMIIMLSNPTNQEIFYKLKMD